MLILSCGKEEKAKSKENKDQDPPAYEQDMGHPGSGHALNGNATVAVTGTPWTCEQWCDEGTSYSFTWWQNGTFKAVWNNCGEYVARSGFRYSPSVDHKTRKFSADYNYIKTGSAGLSFIGAYGWTTNPITEWYIVDDWYSIPDNYFHGKEIGTLVADGEKYTIYIVLKENAPSAYGTTTFIQIFSWRDTNRQKGHINLNKHFDKFAELLHGQTESVPVSSVTSKNFTVNWGKLSEVSLGIDAVRYSGGNSGSIEYNHFGLTDQ